MANKPSANALKEIKANQLYRLGEVKLGTVPFPVEWAHLGTPQTKNPEYDGEYGKYRFDLVIDPTTDDGKSLVAKLKAAHDELITKANEWASVTKTKIKFTEELNIRPQTRKEGDEKIETGKLVLKFAQHAARLDKKTNEVVYTPPVVVDTNGKEVPRVILNAIGNGTLVQVAFDLTAYHMNGSIGTTMKLKKVRLVELKRFGDDINDDDYFDTVVTGGYQVDLSDASTPASTDDAEADVDTDGDF